MENEKILMDNQEVETGVADIIGNEYSHSISETLGYSPEYLYVMQKNYPDMTNEEIIEAVEKQKDYQVYFHHRHEGITEDLIKKYLIIDTDTVGERKITIETPEIHDCNLVKLTPELQDKSYRGYRGDRNVISHLIDKEDYTGEHKTNKLTIVGKRDHDRYYDEDEDERYENEYLYVITAFRGDGKSKREPNLMCYGGCDYEDMKYWMSHALIPEENEKIRRVSSSDWLHKYKEQTKQRETNLIYKKGKKLEYQAFTKYINKLLLDLGREYDKLKVINKGDSIFGGELNGEIVDGNQCIIVCNKGKFGIIEVKSMNEDMINSDGESIEGYRQRLLEKDYSQGFRFEMLKDIDNQNSEVTQEILDFRQNFIKYSYNTKAEMLKKIIQSSEQIKHTVEIDENGDKLSTIIIGNKEYKILEPDLGKYTDEKYSRNITIDHFNGDKKRKEIFLDGIRGDTPDQWLDKKFAEYVKEKESEGFHIPGKEFNEMLLELGKMSGLEKTQEQLLLLIYLTGMDGDYRLSMDGDYRDKLKCDIPMFRSNIGNVLAGVFFMKG